MRTALILLASLLLAGCVDDVDTLDPTTSGVMPGGPTTGVRTLEYHFVWYDNQAPEALSARISAGEYNGADEMRLTLGANRTADLDDFITCKDPPKELYVAVTSNGASVGHTFYSTPCDSRIKLGLVVEDAPKGSDRYTVRVTRV